MTTIPVNINCDLGEGLDNEEAIMPLINSCNIACGGHAGDLNTMKRVIALARQFNVAIGAHPSYPDRENFGRRSLEMDEDALIATIKDQMLTFEKALASEKAELHHIKAHGALYNDIAGDEHLASSYLEAIDDYREKAMLYLPFGSTISRLAADRGFRIVAEAFGDRNYTDNLRLVSRKEPNALLTDRKEVLEHVRRILNGKVRTTGGRELPIKADTICIHSDTANAVEILEYLKQHLT